ncbi:MAG: hypothetical protein ACK5HL_03050 [Bacilli bacterium]
MGKLFIVSGNILDNLKSKDLIVNSTNQYMICGSIYYKSADKELLKGYWKNNFKEQIKVNEVRITPGFNLSLDILHIYFPKAYENVNDIDELIYYYIYMFICAKGKRKQYIELSPKDKYIVRLSYPISPISLGYIEMTEEEKSSNEKK